MESPMDSGGTLLFLSMEALQGDYQNTDSLSLPCRLRDRERERERHLGDPDHINSFSERARERETLGDPDPERRQVSLLLPCDREEERIGAEGRVSRWSPKKQPIERLSISLSRMRLYTASLHRESLDRERVFGESRRREFIDFSLWRDYLWRGSLDSL